MRVNAEGAPYLELAARLGVEIEPALFARALTHRSYAYEHGGLPTNERLEFLGDAVLGLVITETLYRNHPELPEGQLAKLRASVVNMRALAQVAGTLGLGQYLRLGRGEEATGGREKASILADGLEALLGAVYLHAGLEAARQLIHRLFDPLLTDPTARGAGIDWKTALQELAAAQLSRAPDYDIEQSGPDHARAFVAWAVVGGRRLGRGEGSSKKQAEQRAAEEAWLVLSANREVLVGDPASGRAGPTGPPVRDGDGGGPVDSADSCTPTGS